MFFHELQEDEQRVFDEGRETPFTFVLTDEGQDATDNGARLGDAAEEAAGWLTMQGFTAVRVDRSRGRLWVEREESGKVYWTLLSRYRIRREQGLNLVEPA